jgi:hypothetical protein
LKSAILATNFSGIASTIFRTFAGPREKRDPASHHIWIPACAGMNGV